MTADDRGPRPDRADPPFSPEELRRIHGADRPRRSFGESGFDLAIVLVLTTLGAGIGGWAAGVMGLPMLPGIGAGALAGLVLSGVALLWLRSF